MAEESESGEDRTEEATPERREEFRDRGQVVVSREISSTLVLLACALFFGLAIPSTIESMKQFMVVQFQSLATQKISQSNFIGYSGAIWWNYLLWVLPIFFVAATAGAGGTLLQSQMNWSWQKLQPDFSRLNFFKGVTRMFSSQSVVELAKSIGKMVSVILVAYLILHSEWKIVPGLMSLAPAKGWHHWADITLQLLWSVAGLATVIAGGDYFFNFMQVEKQVKMTKQEVKEEIKKREVDPHVKGKIKRMAREYATRKMIADTKTATVVITNPTHYAVALKYEVGMSAPKVVAKGLDFLALHLREIAQENSIPIIENKPLARTLYKIVEVGQEIPESLYKAVSEVIRFVFQLKGIKVAKNTRAEAGK